MKQYHDLLRSILENGTEHSDRTGVGTISHFGFQTRFDLREGFPIVTTKRVPFRWVAEELFWFLSGDTSETNLRARGVDIWAEWADDEAVSRFERALEVWPEFDVARRLLLATRSRLEVIDSVGDGRAGAGIVLQTRPVNAPVEEEVGEATPAAPAVEIAPPSLSGPAEEKAWLAAIEQLLAHGALDQALSLAESGKLFWERS